MKPQANREAAKRTLHLAAVQPTRSLSQPASIPALAQKLATRPASAPALRPVNKATTGPGSRPKASAPLGMTPANDDCGNAIAVTTATPNYSAPFDTTAATDEPDEPSACGSQANSVWYSFVNLEATNVSVRVSTCGSGYDTVVAVWEDPGFPDGLGGSCNFAGFIDIDCNDDFDCPVDPGQPEGKTESLQSQVNFIAEPGKTYKIQVGGFSGSTGPGTIAIDSAQSACDVTVTPGISPFGYVPLSGLGITPVTVGNDEVLDLNLRPFTFAGETYTRIGFSSNGYAIIGGANSPADNTPLNQSFPDPTPPNHVLAPFWTDLNPTAGGALRFGAVTDGTNSWIVLDWENVPETFNPNVTHSFQIWIGQSDDATPEQDITFVYGPDSGQRPNTGESLGLTVGAENKLGTRGQNYYYNGIGTFPTSSTELRVDATPCVTISTQATPGGPVGTELIDSATIANGVNPTGTITFNLYGPNDVCQSPPIFTSVVQVSGNGSYGSDPYAPMLPGTYYWIASYSGDDNNNPVAGACNDPNETADILASSLTTQASADTEINQPISDTATLANALNPTGMITFNLYGPDNGDCGGKPIFTDTVTVMGNGDYTSASYFPTQPGTYRWIASYSGDDNNIPLSGVCNDPNESVFVSLPRPTLTTNATAAAPLGSSIRDVATLTVPMPPPDEGGEPVPPTGTITFSLYGPNDGGCENPPIFTNVKMIQPGNTEPVSSDPYTPAVVGTYYWIAAYSGDQNYGAVSGLCGDPGETSVVAPFVVTLSTTASPSVALGGQISDTATITGGTNPTGTIVFQLFGPDDATCGNGAIFTSVKTVTGNGSYTSDPFTPTNTGLYRWVASYGGDAAHAPATGACNDPNESVSVTGVLRNLSTRLFVQTGDSVGIGGFIITGSVAKKVIVRAIGPSLERFGLTPLLADPVLELHGPPGFVTLTNDNWRVPNQAGVAATGIPPTDDLESAIVATLVPGPYTAVMKGKNGGTGLGLVEIYDLEGGGASLLANLSTRASVMDAGNGVAIAGLILGQTSGNRHVIVRGLGPSLAAAGVANVLANPALELRDSNGALLFTNNDWQDVPSQAAEISAVGLAPTDPLEAAISVNLPGGAFTALLRGTNGGIGVGLVEIYLITMSPAPAN